MSQPNFTNDSNENAGHDQAAEEISSKARDRVDEATDKGRQVAESVPQNAEAFLEDDQLNAAPRAKKRLKEKLDERDAKMKNGKMPEKFTVDLDKYAAFVDRVTSEPSKNLATLIQRYQDLDKAGCNISRLDTAASGIVAEGGEFMEIVKKLKFQGKPWDEANKEHLTKELGDIMWYVAQACLALDVRLDEVMYINTLKLAARYPEGMFDVEYSENRAPGDI
jgi:NTP pyrophosphatase (non-canonical NTP hydrolase)